MRGVMNFEDYPYGNLNEHILVNQKKGFIEMTDSQLLSDKTSQADETPAAKDDKKSGGDHHHP